MAQVERFFEWMLYNARFVVLIAVICSLASSVLMFINGAEETWKGIMMFIAELAGHETEQHGGSAVITILISAVDEFLFATVLLIFSLGLYELFISNIDQMKSDMAKRPSWLRVSSLDDLKESLGKVILMILIVTFLKKTLIIQFQNAIDLLFLGIGILLVSGAMYLTHGKGHHKKESVKEL